MTQKPDDDEILIAAELADERPTANTVPVEKDRWYIERLNGECFGPMSWKELTSCVNAQMFVGDDMVQGELNSRRSMRELFPKFFSVARPPSIEIRQQPTALEQIARDPIKVAMYGLELPPYEKSDPEGIHHANRLRIVGALGVVWLLIILALLIAAAFSKDPWSLAGPAGFFSSTLFGLGYFYFCGALLEWEFFFQQRKVKTLRCWYGDRGARRHCLISAFLPIVIGCVIYLFMFLQLLDQR